MNKYKIHNKGDDMKISKVLTCLGVFVIISLLSCSSVNSIPSFKCYNMKEEQPIMKYGKNGPMFYRRVEVKWHNDKSNTLVLDDNGLPIVLKPSDNDFFDQIIPFFSDSKIRRVDSTDLPERFVLSFVFHDTKHVSMCATPDKGYWVAIERSFYGNRSKNYHSTIDTQCEGMPNSIKIERVKSFNEGYIVYIDENLSYQVWGIEDGEYKLMLNEKVSLDHSLDWLPGVTDVADVNNYHPASNK